MAKEKKKGGKGKKGKKKKEPEVVDPNLLTEVDKTFYELQIADLNRKLARLRSLTQELEVKNEELQTGNKQLDEDRSDIIMFLKRSLQEKSDEINDLQDRLKGMQETRQSETEEFQQQIQDMQQEYKLMQEQLTSEIKLLNGKLNSLEEFRIQRDELMKKYEIQESAMEEQEVEHKKEIYEIEKKFIIGKDRLKKEMEDRLLQLSSEFQDATNLRIAATTHRVIRENIAINNELDVILETHNRLHSENEQLRHRNRVFRMETELHEAEKNKALAKAKVQHNLIERLTNEHEHLTKKLDEYKGISKKLSTLESELEASKRTVTNLEFKIRILEQNLHASRCDRMSLKTDLDYSNAEIERLTDILVEAVMSVEAALKLKPGSEISICLSKRESLLSNLLTLMSKVHDQQARKPSMDSIRSSSAMYVKGDLGFVPCAVELRSRFPTRRNMEVQVGSSLEDLVLGISDGVLTDRMKETIGEEEEYLSSEESREETGMRELDYEVQELGSQVVFDDEPEPLSESSEHAQEVDLLGMVDTKEIDVEKALREGDDYAEDEEEDYEGEELDTDPRTEA